ncbi:MAG TPA: ATP-binding cassette domain-containing protein [Candidatus Limnocylindria bacterium]
MARARSGMIELDDLSFSYRSGEADAVPALRHLSLRIDPGEFVAVIGHNGSGKSTLSKLLTAVLYPSRGEIRIDGIRVEPRSRWEIRRRVAIVFQDPDDQLVANRVRDDVAFGPENLGLPRDEVAERVEASLVALALDASADRLIEDISPGEKQRVAIAGALAMRPLFLILDEPTSLLPVPVASRLIERMRELNRSEGMGVLHITHFMNEAARFDRVLVMDDGQVVLDGTPAEVFQHVDRLREIGLDVPTPVSLAHRLRARGYDLVEEVLDDAGLRRALEALTARRAEAAS